MFGLNKQQASDKLNVQVHAVSSQDAFQLAQRVWAENVRTMRLDEPTGKEFLHFGYDNPKSVIWLQRDQGRGDAFELIVRWQNDETREVFVLTNGQPAGDEQRLKAILNSMLTQPSVVLSNDNSA